MGRLFRSTNTAAAVAAIQTTEPDLEVSAAFTKLPSADSFLDVRRDASGTASYRVRVYATCSAIIKRSVMFVLTGLFGPYLVVAGQRIGVRTMGDQISLVVDGQVVVTARDTEIPASGRACVSWGGPGMPALDDLIVEKVTVL